MHTRRRVGRATDGRLWHPTDLLHTVLVEHGFAGRAVTHRHAHLDHTHTAVTGDRQFRVVAVMRHFFALTGKLHRFNDVNALRHINVLPIDIDGDIFDYALNIHGLKSK